MWPLVRTTQHWSTPASCREGWSTVGVRGSRAPGWRLAQVGGSRGGDSRLRPSLIGLQPRWRLLIGCLTGIYPITIHIHRLGQISDGGLEFLQANRAGYNPSISAPFHFHITRFFVIAEWTGELGIQVSCQLLLWRRLSLRLTASHCS